MELVDDDIHKSFALEIGQKQNGDDWEWDDWQ